HLVPNHAAAPPELYTLSLHDALPILHEYGHGVTNRLVGARTSTSCLVNIQSAAMDEGWSDYFAISFYNNPVFDAYDSQDPTTGIDRKSTRLNSSHDQISYAVFCLKKK